MASDHPRLQEAVTALDEMAVASRKGASMMNCNFRLAIALCAVLALTGCGRSASYRYKLTLSLDTPEGERTAFNVVEVRYFDVSMPMRGIMHESKGQAVYVDLGSGRRPLIALLTVPTAGLPGVGPRRWFFKEAIGVIADHCHDLKRIQDLINVVEKMGECEAPISIEIADLPDLVTFADVNDPSSVMLVDPLNLSAALGSGISWRSMTLQATSDPNVTGIEKQLPWLAGMGTYLSGRHVRTGNSLPEILSGADFEHARFY